MNRETVVRFPAHQAEAEGVEPIPLTERIASWLPGPRPLWLVVWVFVPWMHAAVTLALQAAGQLPRWENATPQLLNRAAFSFAVFLSLWGSAKIARGLESLQASLPKLIPEVADPVEPFRRMGSTAAPLLLTAGTVVIFGGQSVVEHDSWLRGIVTGGSWLLIGIPLWTFVWVYLSLQIGLHMFGRFHLALQLYPGDRSLGLRPLGRLAFTGFWTFVGLVTPLVISTVSNRLGLIIGLLILLAGMVLFFLSLRRLNRQMVAAKQRELEWARQFYAQAFEPVRAQGTLEALQGQSATLSAAEALEKRAERIQEWPFDEATFTRVVTISSTVVAAIIARVLLAPFEI